MEWIKRLFAKKITIQEVSIDSAGFKLVEVDPDKHYILFVSERVHIDDLLSSSSSVLQPDKINIVRVF